MVPYYEVSAENLRTFSFQHELRKAESRLRADLVYCGGSIMSKIGPMLASKSLLGELPFDTSPVLARQQLDQVRGLQTTLAIELLYRPKWPP
jgi:hypothetical protein